MVLKQILLSCLTASLLISFDDPSISCLVPPLMSLFLLYCPRLVILARSARYQLVLLVLKLLYFFYFIDSIKPDTLTYGPGMILGRLTGSLRCFRLFLLYIERLLFL